jgi:hypothetical protein
MPVTVFGWMDSYFCRRHRENQPPMTGVHGRKSEDVPQESAVSHRIFAVKDHMRTKDHKFCPYSNYSRLIFSFLTDMLFYFPDQFLGRGLIQHTLHLLKGPQRRSNGSLADFSTYLSE